MTPVDPGLPNKSLIAMVHVGALPGSPRSRRTVAELARQAAAEARLLAPRAKDRADRADALILENMHDAPYVHGDHDPATTAAMTRVCLEVRDAVDVPLGVQVLSGGNREALAIAATVGAAFIRCENFVFAHVADEGLLATAEAGPLLRYRRQIGAEHIRVFCDIKKKHASHAITADVPIEDAAEGALFFGADGLIVTGAATGRPASDSDLAAVARVARAHARQSDEALGSAAAPRIPVLVGSGATPQTLGSLWRSADGVIIGSWFEHEGLWHNAPDPVRVRELFEAAAAARRAC